jgi:excisionase family DNA binding protein
VLASFKGIRMKELILRNGIDEDGIDEVIRNSRLFIENKINSEWLSTKEAALVLSLTENALRIMVHRGQIQVYKLGRRLRFRLIDCLALFKKKGA